MFYYFWHDFFILLFGILLVKNAVLLVLQAAAPEAVITVKTEAAIENLTVEPANVIEAVLGVCLAADRFVDELRMIVVIHVHAILELCGIRDEVTVVQADHFVTHMCILRVDDGIARAVFRVDTIHVFARQY